MRVVRMYYLFIYFLAERVKAIRSENFSFFLSANARLGAEELCVWERGHPWGGLRCMRDLAAVSWLKARVSRFSWLRGVTDSRR